MPSLDLKLGLHLHYGWSLCGTDDKIDKYQDVHLLRSLIMEDTLFNRTFRDSQGNIVLAQMPNLPILVWLAATLLNLIPTTSNIHTGLDALAFGSLFTWAWLELFQGVNYFRRALGLIVLLGAIASRLSWSITGLS